MLLGYINGEWIKDIDYLEQINRIRAKRPLKLGFAGQLTSDKLPKDMKRK